MRISDWSSDVCSSDLCARRTNNQPAAAMQFLLRIGNGLLNSRIFQRFTRCIAHVLQKLRDRIKLVQHLACGLTALDDGSQNLQRRERALACRSMVRQDRVDRLLTVDIINACPNMLQNIAEDYLRTD